MTELPPWMKEASDEHVRSSMKADPQLWIDAARFGATQRRDGYEALSLITQAREIRGARTLPEWRLGVASFPASAVRLGGKTRSENPDRPALAFFIDQALARLLELVGGPNLLKEQLSFLLTTSQPVDAARRAKLQAILIESPRLTVPQLAEAAGCSRALAYRYLKDGTVRRVP